MSVNSVTQLTPVLQIAISPAILISGVGLLLLTMTNRLGRAIDRSRSLSYDFLRADNLAKPAIKQQLAILWRRARLIRTAITFAATSALAAALLVIMLFLAVLFAAEVGAAIIGIFIVCLLCLIMSLVVFIYDIDQSLSALKLELRIDQPATDTAAEPKAG